MKFIYSLLSVLCLVAFSNTQTIAQNTCCDANGAGTTVAPEVTVGLQATPVPGDQNTTAPTLAVQASVDLGTVEYLITKRGQAALDAMGNPDTTGGGGDVVIGTDADGIFMPNNQSRDGVTLAVGDTFDVTAVGYDLQRIKLLADSLLNGRNAQGTPCCDLFGLLAIFTNQPAIAGFCDSMNNAGIFGANDINGMNEILVIFDVFSSGQTSVASIISTMEIINSNGSNIPAECGGTGANNFVPYGVNKAKRYGYVKDMDVAVQKLSEVSLFVVFPNPTDNFIHVNFTTERTVDLSVRLYDAMGKQVKGQELGSVNGNTQTTLELADLPAGIYTLELTDGTANRLQKVVIH